MKEHPQEQKKVEKSYIPSLPYPQWFKRELKDQQFPKFLKVFKKLEINIPLAEALEQMPLYAKFLKELINQKRSWNEKETVILTQECSAVIQKSMPPKLKDHGSFIVSCTIGNMTLEKARCDLGASINLMPLSVMKKLAIEEAKPTRMSLQMADRSLKIPNAVVENLLVKIGEVHDEQMIINVFKAMQYPPEEEKNMRVEMIEDLDRKGSENQVADHLSRLPQGTSQEATQPVNESFPDEHLLQIQQAPWFADIANYKVGKKIPQGFTKQQLKKLLSEARKFLWDEPFLFKRCPDGMIRRCIPENEMRDILWHCHGSTYGGYFGPERTAAKMLQSGFYLPTIFKDAREFVHQCNECQRARGLTKRNEMPKNFILEVELFDL
ncbi:uncharacterized protein [Arachis hypogaea]|uniref:uncharacterized protein n=1 Tax=Arachis hypogaea TaxID=3818 RepID=UPI003B2261BD